MCDVTQVFIAKGWVWEGDVPPPTPSSTECKAEDNLWVKMSKMSNLDSFYDVCNF